MYHKYLTYIVVSYNTLCTIADKWSASIVSRTILSSPRYDSHRATTNEVGSVTEFGINCGSDA